MSWWVGKNREAFTAALKDPAQRVLQREPPPAPAQEPAVPTPEPAPSTKSATTTRNARRWNDAFIAEGRCARCGQARTDYAQLCNDCQAKYTARKARARRGETWKPGCRGRVPKPLREYLALADVIKAGIEASHDASDAPALRRAAIVMLVGFMFRQRLDWIVGYTRFQSAECKRVIARLRRYGIWRRDGTIACQWLEALITQKRVTKRALREAELAFWLDAAVGAGDLTRETVNGDFQYGLPSWERQARERGRVTRCTSNPAAR